MPDSTFTACFTGAMLGSWWERMPFAFVLLRDFYEGRGRKGACLFAVVDPPLLRHLMHNLVHSG